MHYNNLYAGKDFNVIYTKDFKVNADINFYIEIMCDYVTSSVIPVIVPKMRSKAKSKRKTSIKEDDIIVRCYPCNGLGADVGGFAE